jgi:hypothetical protein
MGSGTGLEGLKGRYILLFLASRAEIIFGKYIESQVSK